jgi:diguanylate cyclase (GGDEF)-like protein
LDAFHDLVDESGAELGNAFALAIDEVSDEITTLRSRERVQLTVSFAILLLGFVVGGLLSRRVYRSITSPLKTLEEAATRLGQDDLSHRIDVHGDDELARVGSAFNSMAERLQQSRDELSHLALHDQLTGLPNRALFIEQLGHAVARSRRRGSPVSVLFLDLDGFKAVNDTFGHEAGDEVLVGVADRLRRTLRDEDMIARLGGDEFGIILEEELQGATLTAERIIRRFEKPWSSSSGISPVGVSIGISSRAGDEEVDELLRQSDIAMYAAKAAGKGRWRIFSPDLGGELRAVQSLRTELQHAVEAEEFAVHYQPVMNLQKGSIVGVEALVRWNHPKRGLLAPSEFLEEAEASGHIIHIDRWVLRQACRQVRQWQRHVSGAESLSVHVNLSARQLQHPGLAEEIAEAVRVSGLAPNDLILEITETTLVRDAEAAASELRKLKDLGVRLALDDFGTGFSSLSHLHEFPIDIIKIDRSFVSAIGDGSKRSELVRALVSLGTTLGLVVVAEGIEDRAQLEYLRSIGCELGQGYYFAKPLEADRLEMLLPQASLREPVLALAAVSSRVG